MFLKILSLFLPWPLRRRALEAWFGFNIHPSARIGLSWVFPKKLIMDAGTSIDHFNVAINLDCIKMDENASIGRGNWITGFPTNTTSRHFEHNIGRKAVLHLGESAAIVKSHHLDCTDQITIGRFSTLAGYRSQLLTHSIDVIKNRQDSSPITIGEHTFVGTNVTILGGATLPSHCVLGAKALLNKNYCEEWKVYGGVPAKIVGDIPKDAGYFSRKEGFVY